MENFKIENFNLVGISMRTTNENGQSQIDIPKLWHNFMVNQIGDNLPNKIDNTIYCLYCNYEKDHTKPYDVFLGFKVTSLDNVPIGMASKSIVGGNFTKFKALGDVQKGSVFNEWLKIWNSNIPRTFVADFEVYGPKAFDGENAEVDIFIGIE
jgi:predicted transcriptional regulator YdeE